MSIYPLIPLFSFIAYSALMYITLRHKPRIMVHKTFVLYLLGVTLWAVFAFLLYTNLFPESVSLLSQLMLFSAIYAVVAYYHFLRAFMNKSGGIGVALGYGGLIALIPLIMQDRVAYIINTPFTLSASPNIEYTLLGISLIALGSVALVGWAIVTLLLQYRHSADPLIRDKITYLIVGFVMMALFGATKLHPVVTNYPLAHLGNLGNALFITYAIVRYQLLDIRIIIRRGLVYLVAGLCFVGLYLALLLGLLRSLDLKASYANLVASAGVAVLIAILFYPMKNTIQQWIERLIYKETYNYRSMLLAFADKMSQVLNLEELAKSMLTLITKAIYTKEARLYLPNDDNGDFISRFNTPNHGSGASPMKLVKDNPVVTWLAKEGRPLSREQVDIIPQFKGLWEKERKQFAHSEIELYFPIKNKDALIGILATGGKLNGSSYRAEDLDLIMTMATQAGVAMENAQLYTAAKTKANTDELTGLSNHRYFHERLEEEIGRGLRFGVIFSLILLDLDLFKKYNDIHGHLAGDQILKQIGGLLTSSVRGIDMGFRYGGDEFAVILPGTSYDDAYKVAERTRKEIEQAMSSQGLLLTCSLGIASWPTDGVVREGLIHCADSALYHAKRTGNRTCLYSDAISSGKLRLRARPMSRKETISMIYALATAVDARDHYTYGHSKRVSNYAVAIAEALGLPPQKIDTIRTAGLLHDIGKIGIADKILDKAGLLLEEEWKPVRAHPTLGVSILKHIDGLAPCLPGIQHHHERYNGTGYPSGLAGDNIPQDARVIAVADAYEAMTSPRPYRQRTLTHKEALEELIQNAGTQFDPELVKVFCSLKKRTLQKVKVT